MTGRALLLFVDGVGLGARDAGSNPFLTATTPVLRELLEGRLAVEDEAPFHGVSASLVPVDATMGAAGIPQSGTGHATLLTGQDAVHAFGRHQGPWVPTMLRPLVAERSVLARAAEAGRTVAFANAYPAFLLGRIKSDRPLREVIVARGLGPLRAGPPLAALGAGLLTRHRAALERGDAVASEIVNDGWIDHLGETSLPRLTPAEAGVNLARIAGDHDLTLFAHYSTDIAGHRGGEAGAKAALERLDAFLGGVLAALPPDVLLVVASDHGNIEDVRTGHTRNPALCLVVGEGHAEVSRAIHDLADIAPALLRHLVVGFDTRDDWAINDGTGGDPADPAST